MTTNPKHLAWLDLEMTGLNPDQDRIIEVAILISDEQLNLVAEGPVIAVHQSEATLALMDDWNQKTHGKSGLIERVRQSTIAEAEAEQQCLDFLALHLPANASPLCGNTIWQDRRFLARYMPRMEAFFHYRNIDVSTLKELATRWYPDLPKFQKKEAHQALDDIRESLEELRFYRESLFIQKP